MDGDKRSTLSSLLESVDSTMEKGTDLTPINRVLLKLRLLEKDKGNPIPDMIIAIHYCPEEVAITKLSEFLQKKENAKPPEVINASAIYDNDLHPAVTLRNFIDQQLHKSDNESDRWRFLVVSQISSVNDNNWISQIIEILDYNNRDIREMNDTEPYRSFFETLAKEKLILILLMPNEFYRRLREPQYGP